MLTVVDCNNATCPADKKRLRLSDSGGLYLEVSPAGSKRWFWKFRKGASDTRIALGSYPDVGLAAARRARDAARLQRAGGTDPVQAKKLTKLKGAVQGHTFKEVALEWHGKQVDGWSPEHAKRTLRQMERDLFPWLGDRPMAKMEPMELLAVLQKIEQRGAVETADRALMLARQVFDYWLSAPTES